MENTNKAISLRRSLVMRVLVGAIVALGFILFFVVGVDEPKPEWHRTWWIRPLVITPLAGAAGGLFFHLMAEVVKTGTWKKIIVTLIGSIGYMIAVWLGTVLGLAGTLWD